MSIDLSQMLWYGHDMPNEATQVITPDIVGQNIRLVRTRRGLKGRELAELVGDTPQRVSQIEGGQNPQSLDTLNKYARSLSVQVRDLVDHELNTRIESLVPEVVTTSEAA
jgi:transcriptional regulator with XRE-family HTH domain